MATESYSCRQVHISADLVRMGRDVRTDRDEPSVSDSAREYYRRKMGLDLDHDVLHSNHDLMICFADSADCMSCNLDLQKEMLWAIPSVGIHLGGRGRMLRAEEEVKAHLYEHGSGNHHYSIRWRPS